MPEEPEITDDELKALKILAAYPQAIDILLREFRYRSTLTREHEIVRAEKARVRAGVPLSLSLFVGTTCAVVLSIAQSRIPDLQAQFFLVPILVVLIEHGCNWLRAHRIKSGLRLLVLQSVEKAISAASKYVDEEPELENKRLMQENIAKMREVASRIDPLKEDSV